MQPIKVHIIPTGPNPWNPVLILEELGLPYNLNSFSFELVKQKPFTDINPNGRAPAIEDPNTGLTLWESGAVIQYIIQQYDTKHVLSDDTLKEKHLCNQRLRYSNEIKCVRSVLKSALEGKQWLVGDNMTFADLSFTVWNDRIDAIIFCAPEKKFEDFPNVQAWHECMKGRPAWKNVIE